MPMPVQLHCILRSHTFSAGVGAGVGEGEGEGDGVGVGAGDGAGAAHAATISEITNAEATKTVKILVFNIILLLIF